MVQNLPRCRRRIGSRFVALLAIQMGTHILVASSDGEHPRAIREWRLMPYVLSMTTGQIGDPVTIVILVISDDRLLHVVMTLVWQEWRWNRSATAHVTAGVSSATLLSSTSPFLERQLQPLSGRNIRPVFVFILVEATDKNDLSIEMAKFRKTYSTAQWIDDARIILPDYIYASL